MKYVFLIIGGAFYLVAMFCVFAYDSRLGYAVSFMLSAKMCLDSWKDMDKVDQEQKHHKAVRDAKRCP